MSFLTSIAILSLCFDVLLAATNYVYPKAKTATRGKATMPNIKAGLDYAKKYAMNVWPSNAVKRKNVPNHVSTSFFSYFSVIFFNFN